jgi:hypothetical protein
MRTEKNLEGILMAEKRRTMDELIIEAKLSGDTLNNATDFAKFLNDESILPDGKHGAITYNDKVICYMHVDGNKELPGPWTVWSDGDYSEDLFNYPLDEAEKEIIWANVNICGNCGAKCAPGSRKKIFGKQFDNLCGAVLAFNDPKGKTLECLKKILKSKKESLIGE